MDSVVIYEQRYNLNEKDGLKDACSLFANNYEYFNSTLSEVAVRILKALETREKESKPTYELNKKHIVYLGVACGLLGGVFTLVTKG